MFNSKISLLVLTGALGLSAQSVELTGHTDTVRAVACSADGKSIASGGGDGTIILWDAAARQERASFKGDDVLSVAVAPDSTRIALGERADKVRLLDASAKEIKTLEGHRPGVVAVEFSPDGRTLLSFAGDGTIRFWDLGTGVAQAATIRVPDRFFHAKFSVDGKWLAAGTISRLYFYNMLQKKIAWNVKTDGPVRGVAVSADARLVAVAVGDDSVRLLDASSGKERSKVEVDANGLAFSPDGTKLAAAGHDGYVHIITMATMKVAAKLKGHDRMVREVCFLPDGHTLVSVGFDSSVRLWPVR